MIGEKPPALTDVIRALTVGNITLATILIGTIILGSTGSGKTSGPGRFLALGMLAHAMRMGFLILCAKPGEAEQGVAWATEAGRAADIIRWGVDSPLSFNLLEYEASQPGSSTHTIVALLMEIATAIAPHESGEAGEARFFLDAMRHALTNAVDLCRLAKVPVDMATLRRIILSAPKSLREAQSQQWQTTSYCYKLLVSVHDALDRDDADQVAIYDEVENWFVVEYCQISDRTRPIIDLSISMLVRPFVVPPLRRLFTGETTVSPDDVFSGKIWIVDLPTQGLFQSGKLAQLAVKRSFQNAVLRRQGNDLHPAVMWIDEAAQLVTQYDAEYQSVARQSMAATVMICQSTEGLKHVLGSDEAVEALLSNLQCKWFCQTSSVATAEYASELLGSRYIDVDSSSVSQSFAQPNGSMQGSSSTSSQLRRYIEPSEFARLLKGGAPDYRVSTILYNGGETYPGNGGERVPYLRLNFSQRR